MSIVCCLSASDACLQGLHESLPLAATLQWHHQRAHLQALHQRAVAGLVRLQPGALHHVIAQGILGNLTTAATAGAAAMTPSRGVSE